MSGAGMPVRSRPVAGRRPARVPGVIGVVVLAVVLTGSVAVPAGTAAGPAGAAADPAGSAVSAPGTAGPAASAGTSTAAPDLAVRGTAADAFARARGGRTGIVIRDRVTGAVWRNADAGTAFRAASTVKLGIAVDLLVRSRAAGIPLDPATRAALTAMITASDNGAADRLWARAGGPAAGARLARYGLRDAIGTGGWGGVRCTPDDLERLVSYALERTAVADRATLVGLLRAVVPAQRWGVLGVAATAAPGAKNGWTPDGGSWAVATVGFLGPAERYTVAVMTAGPPGGDFVGGVETVTGTVTTLVLGLV
ncbi:MAG TPA: tat pathway signal sequence [Mycobacteriales bacterium]